MADKDLTEALAAYDAAEEGEASFKAADALIRTLRAHLAAPASAVRVPDPQDAERSGQFVPGSYGCHEAMHMASVFCDIIGHRICEHPAVEANVEWLALAMAAHQNLFDLYQAIGAAHMDACPPVIPEVTAVVEQN